MIKKTLFIVACLISAVTTSARADNVNKYRQSISIQFGLNGNLHDSKSYGLAFIPPDLAYSRELFDNDIINVSTATFYDNIGVEIRDTNFSYRVGQRFDVGVELGKYTPYVTLGFGIIRNAHHYQTSPVYGSGILFRLSKQLLWANEINFQNVLYKNSHYEIVNLSTGLTYGF